MNALVIKNGIVENAIVVESIEQFQSESPEMFAQYDYVIDAATVAPAWIGWAYDGQSFTAPG
jgi:hypothetical protein